MGKQPEESENFEKFSDFQTLYLMVVRPSRTTLTGKSFGEAFSKASKRAFTR